MGKESIEQGRAQWETLIILGKNGRHDAKKSQLDKDYDSTTREIEETRCFEFTQD